MEDGLALVVDEEGVDRPPLLVDDQVLDLVQGGVDAHHTDHARDA